MKRYIALILSIALWFAFSSCGTDEKPPTECNLGETVAFTNGVQFTVTEANFATEIKGTYTTYRADDGNKYLLLKITVVNNSKETFKSDGKYIWLNYNGARIAQIKLVSTWSYGYDDIMQSPTTSVTYNSFFQVGNQIELSDLALIISNGRSLFEERLTIMLTP